MGEAAAALPNKVPGGQRPALVIIAGHGGHIALLRALEGDHRQGHVQIGPDVRRPAAQDDGRHLIGFEHIDIFDLLLTLMEGVAEHDFIPMPGRLLLQKADHPAKVRMGHRGDDDPDDVGAPFGEGTGQLVGPVVQPLHGFIDRLPRFIADVAPIVEHAGDRGHRNARQLRHILESRHAAIRSFRPLIPPL